MDIYLSYNSKSRGIPWSPLNCAKITITFILVLLQVLKILVTRVLLPAWLPWYQAYPVDLYVPVIHAITLVNKMICLIDKEILMFLDVEWVIISFITLSR